MWRKTVALAAVATFSLIAATMSLRAQQAVPGGGVGGIVPGAPPRDRAAPPKGTAIVRGRVLASGGTTPLRRAQVVVAAADGLTRHTTTTDGEGRYEVKELPAGRYTISVSKGGYVGLQYGQRRPFEPGTPVAIADGETKTSLDVALPKGSVIAGRITDEFGEPVAQAQVMAQREQYGPDGQRRLVPVGSIATTDDLGQFRLHSLMPGEYVVGATYRGSSTVMIGSFGVDTSESFSPTFYPGTVNANEADPVTVSLGQETTVQFALSAARMARVSGVVVDSSGRPLTGAMLLLLPASGGLATSLTTTQVGADGSFAIANVAPGDYIVNVQVVPGLGGNAIGEAAAYPVTVGGSDLAGLRIATGKGTLISGRVEFEGTSARTGGPLPPRVMAQPSELGRISIGMGLAVANGVIGDDGTFQLSVPNQSQVLLRVNTPPAWTLKLVEFGDADVTDQAIDVSGKESVDGVRIVLTDKLTTVTGRVADGQGRSIADYVVVVQPSDPKEGAAVQRYLRLARPDQNGQFTLSGLPPGRYVATALESLEQGRHFVPDVQARLRDLGRSFTLAEGGSASIELRLSAGVD